MRTRTIMLAASAATVMLGRAALAQDPATAGTPGGVAAPAAAAGDTSQATALQAIVMEVQGKARWRTGPDAEWRDAKVNDLLDPGAEVRTGLRSRLTMRVGRNATVLVDSGTSFSVPELAMEGGTLRTTAAVKTGRVDFKVDKVGFANDFKVVTPQTTLSVRGTGFSLATGPLNGFEITGARTNLINAIEIRYVQQNFRYFLSGGARSSSERPEPVQNAFLRTVGPPPVVGAIATSQQLVQQATQGTAGNAPTNPQQYQQQNAAESNGAAGGNAIVQAAEVDGASDDMQNLKDLLPTPPGSSGSEQDPLLKQLVDPFLRDGLRTVRREVPALLADLPGVTTPAEALKSRADALASSYPDEGELADRLSSLEPSATAISQLQHTITLGTGPMPSERFAQVSATQAAVGASVFTRPPLQNGDDTSSTADPGIRTALQYASMWASHDLTDSQVSAGVIGQLSDPQTPVSPQDAVLLLRQMNSTAQRWTIDATVQAPDGTRARSPVLLALTLNEVVQEAWDGSVRSMLAGVPSGGAIADRHDKVRAGMAELLSALESHHYGQTLTAIPDMVAEFERASSQEDTAASRQAAQEYRTLANSARVALAQALDKARDAAAQSADARSQAQRVFLNSVSNQYVSEAAGIALSCQESTRTVLEKAIGIGEQYRTSKERVRQAGLLPADLNLGGSGPR